MQHGLGIGIDDDILSRLGKTRIRHGDGVLTDGHSAELKLAIVASVAGLSPVGGFGPEHHHGTRNRAMLRVVNDPADGTEDGSAYGDGEQNQAAKERDMGGEH